MKIITIIIWSILTINQLNADTEPLPIQFNLETNKPIGTLIGSIRDKIQPPYYIVPIIPDNQDLFNKYVSIDLDTGLINSNSILNTDTNIKQLKFSVLSINEGIANLIIINIVNNEQTTTSTSTTTKTTTTTAKKECFNLNSNTLTQFKFNDKSDCFEINNEPSERVSNWYSIILIECHSLFYLNRNSIQAFNNSTIMQDSIAEKIANFNLRTDAQEKKSWIEIECTKNNLKHVFNLNLNDSNLKLVTIDQYIHNNKKTDHLLSSYLSYLEKYFKILILTNKFDNCSIIEPIVILNSTVITTSETTTGLDNDIKTQVLNYNIKICLIILFVSLIVLLIMLYGLFMCYKQNKSNKFENMFQIDNNNVTISNDTTSNRMIFSSSSTANLTYKTQTSTINSRYEDEYVKTNENYLNIVISPYNNKKQTNNVIFNYSNGYLADIGVNMMENLNESKSTIRYDSYSAQQQQQQHNHEQQLFTSSNDEHFQMWASMMNWKPDFNDISCVLNDLALLKDLK